MRVILKDPSVKMVLRSMPQKIPFSPGMIQGIPEKDEYEHFLHCIGHQIFLITTYDQEKEPYVAVKTKGIALGNKYNEEDVWFPEIFILNCSKASNTYRNAVRIGEFVINYPLSKDFDKVKIILDISSPEKECYISKLDFSTISSEVVSTPRIDECFFHVECTVDKDQLASLPAGVLIGKVDAVSVDELVLTKAVTSSSGILSLSPLFFMGDHFFIPKNLKE